MRVATTLQNSSTEVVVPADQRSLRPEADQDVAGGTGGRGRRAGPSPSDDPEQGRGAREPSRLSDLTVVVEHLHASLCEGVEDRWARAASQGSGRQLCG